MTEAEWLSCRDASAMVGSMVGRASDRKVRLFGVACCRYLGRLPDVPEFSGALEASEQYVDGKPNKAALRRARKAVRLARLFTRADRGGAAEWAALWLAEVAASENAMRTVSSQIDQLVWRGDIPGAGWPPAADLARCIFGNPSRSPEIRLEGLSPSVIDLARSIYDDRAFERLPILGDALEEAGCVDASIAGHCREAGPHARGCWVVDLILGRS